MNDWDALSEEVQNAALSLRRLVPQLHTHLIAKAANPLEVHFPSLPAQQQAGKPRLTDVRPSHFMPAPDVVGSEAWASLCSLVWRVHDAAGPYVVDSALHPGLPN